MTRAVTAQALRSAARVGEFFAVDVDPADSGLPLRTLLSDPQALDDRVARTRHIVAESNDVARRLVPLRTAASTDQFGLVARLLSPAIGACAVAGVAVAFGPDNVSYRSGHPRMAVTAATGRTVGTETAAAEALHAYLLASVVGPLTTAYAARYHLSTQVLWGNVASALNGAVHVLDVSHIPQRLSARDIAADLLRTSDLAGMVRATAPRFVRNSCCLWYRIPDSAVCGDCVLSA